MCIKFLDQETTQVLEQFEHSSGQYYLDHNSGAVATTLHCSSKALQEELTLRLLESLSHQNKQYCLPGLYIVGCSSKYFHSFFIYSAFQNVHA